MTALPEPVPGSEASDRPLVLVGNPNVGKSVMFMALTGRYVTVSNYPGTTVEITRATATLGGQKRLVIDTPGTNGLIPQSEDEKVTRDVLLDLDGVEVLQVGDLKNLRRTLLLTAQIAEFGVPLTLCLNMSDEARDLGIAVDTEMLSARLGISVVATSALRRWNIERLKREATDPRISPFEVRYPEAIERAIDEILPLLDHGPAVRGLAVSIIAGDETLLPYLEKQYDAQTRRRFDEIRERTQAGINEPIDYVIGRERLAAIDAVITDAFTRPTEIGTGFRQWLGGVSMHPLWGVPVLGVVLWVAWWFVGNLGAGTLVDFFESVIFNQWINPAAIRALDFIFAFPHVHALEEGAISAAYTATAAPQGVQLAARAIHDLLVGPYGVLTMAVTYAIAIVLPVVTTFFIFFGLLEDSGYLPRLAVMLNRIFKKMGLNGKAVLPMVLGLGCDTMATLTTRILETRKERVIVTLLLALGVPCSAQLGVIMAMLAPLNPAALLVWLGVMLGSMFLVGWLASLLVKGEAADFLLEVPPIRRPKLSNIWVKVMARTEWYLKEAVPLFIVGTLLLYVLDATGLLVKFQAAISPLVVGMLGLPADAANAFLIGFLRRDYGAAGLFQMQREGALDGIQTVVSLTVITLFIPCIANLLMIIKERGLRTGMGMAGFITVYAFGIGWGLDRILRGLGVSF
jgi:ferrous iron transport protein B